VIACSLSPLVEMHVYYYVNGLRWLINDDDDYITIMMYLPCSTVCLLEGSRFKLHLYSCIMNMVKMIKVKY
jgi:hypothetical protein